MQGNCSWYSANEMNDHLVKPDGICRSVEVEKEQLLSIVTLK
jgi:hypothetical protein